MQQNSSTQESSSTQNSSTNSNTPVNKSPWYRSQGLLFSLFLIASIHFVGAGFYIAGQFQIHPTVLILKHEACDLVREHGVAAEPHGADNCLVTVPYNGSIFPSIGTLHLPDENITIATDQLTVVAIMNSTSWTPLQIGLISWQIISVILPIIFLVLLGRTLI